MECNHGKFWIGLGIGSVLGAVAYRLSRTAKAKRIEKRICDAVYDMRCQAGEAIGGAQQEALNLGSKVLENGAELADKVAKKADDVANKAKDKWSK